MTLDGLFTAAALLIAVYAVMPAAGRMNISFRMGAMGRAVAGGAFLLILYLQFYPTFRAMGLTPGLGLAKWHITPANASFLVFLCAALFLFFYARRKNLSPSRVGKFEEFVHQLRGEKKYTGLFALIEGNLSWLERVYSKDFFRYRMRAALAPPPFFDPASLDMFLEHSDSDAEKDARENLNAAILAVRRFLSSRFSSGEKESLTAENIIFMLTDDQAAKAMASAHPDLALSILGKEFPLKVKFADAFLTALMQDEKSALYEEIKEGNCVDSKGYQFPDRQRILGFLFNDCKKANKLQVWRPVGEFILNTLYAKNSCSPDPFNAPYRDKYSPSVRRTEYEIPLLAGVRFFNIMVSCALMQNIRWHMWLYYFRYFVDEALSNLNPDARVDMSAEFPTLYHRFLYEIVACLCGWISCVEWKVPTTQENAAVKYTDPVDENESIVKSSMLCMGNVTKQIMLSDKVHLKFKYYIMDMVFHQCLELMRNPKTSKHGEALLNAVICGGITHCGVLIDMEYKDFLLEAAHHGKAIDVPVWGGTLVAQLRQTIEAAKVRERY